MKSHQHALYERQLKNWDGGASKRAWADYFFNKLNLETTLKCHGGCVNCLQWCKAGRYLLSGSDDKNVCLWEPLEHKLLARIPSHHGENIFSVKFVNKEKQVISGAGDGEVRHLDIASTSVLSAWRCHRHRVKRCCTLEDDDNLVISSSEDGTARQFDIREGHTCSSTDSGCSNTLIRLANCSIKSINSNPMRTHLLCVGASDDIARVYDRRYLSLTHAGGSNSTGELYRYLPGHLAYPTVDEQEEENRFYTGPSITWCTFDPTGNFLLCNMGGEQIYLYDVKDGEKVVNLEIMSSEAEEDQQTIPSAQADDFDPKTAAIKEEGNRHYNVSDFQRAVTAYSKCLALYPNSVVLLNNRAQAYLKRGWKGDHYAALRDSIIALSVDPNNEKAHFRQIQSLHAMKYNKLAKTKLKTFQDKFSRTPATDPALKTLWDNVSSAIENGQKDPQSRTDILDCVDYTRRYTGHCNCKTDIKEANFFGPDQEYIMAGSDDKHFFFWDRHTSQVLKVYKGDHSLVNCVQPNPHLPVIATSGLEKVVKLWSPQSHIPDLGEDAPREPLMNDDETSLWEIVMKNQAMMDSREPFPTFAMIQNAMLGMLDPDSFQNSCNPS